MNRTAYRVLLAVVLILAIVFTLGVIGVVPFRWSQYITVFMLVLYVILKRKPLV